MRLLPLYLFGALTPLAVSQDLNTSKTDYNSLYKGRCAESTTAISTSIYPYWQIQWSPFTGYTNIISRTWTTIYPSPTPTSFPATVRLTHISSATEESWATRSNGEVLHNFVTLVVVSFEYDKEFSTPPAGLVACKTVG
ncbi:hypothetical protein V8F20_010647 [Naviculisporaceae sp. PSN 640]